MYVHDLTHGVRNLRFTTVYGIHQWGSPLKIRQNNHTLCQVCKEETKGRSQVLKSEPHVLPKSRDLNGFAKDD